MCFSRLKVLDLCCAVQPPKVSKITTIKRRKQAEAEIARENARLQMRMQAMRKSPLVKWPGQKSTAKASANKAGKASTMHKSVTEEEPTPSRQDVNHEIVRNVGVSEAVEVEPAQGNAEHAERVMPLGEPEDTPLA